MRFVHFLFGLTAYISFNAVFLYFLGFLANFQVPKSIDTPITDIHLFQAVAIDMLLIGIFAIHHSVSPREFVKKWLKKHVPWHLERSVYVMIASLLLALLMWQWKPVTRELWRIEDAFLGTMIYAFFAMGALSSLAASFHIDHYDLFGLRQVYFNLRNIPYQTPEYHEKGFYKFVRHPIMLGTMIALWCTPIMTVGHFLFAATLTLYIFIGIYFEERDLRVALGHSYKEYQERIPMIFPFFKKNRKNGNR
ncbi:MAG: isoprenylcysteine carboxylmethyltransferase family protein [Magnetococcales bacterium]|nr:isoprenylcysteine carboxylmethyltransferase family protein [Magnetococcales bacterium]